MGFIAELKRRNVFRVGIGYLILAWVVIQVTDTVAPVLNLPDWTLAFVTWFGIVGFPFALFFAWAFELTPEGIKLEKDVDRSQSVTHSTGRKIDFVIIGLLAVALAFVVLDNYVLKATPDKGHAAAEPTPALAENARSYDSIGVLPFTNMSNDPEQEYFSDGIAEELLNALAKLENLQVAARTSSFAFKGQNKGITEIGNKLKVDTVLEGSVRKAGTRLRITAQLIDVANGYHLWSETYDRELTDVFAIQDEITAAIVAALRLHLDTGAMPAIAKSEATSVEAYDAYLLGRQQLRGAGPDARRAALTSFRAANESAPDFAPAWAARAFAVMSLLQTDFYGDIPRDEARLLARSNIDRALALDPNQAEAYIAEAMLLEDDYRYEEALQSLEKAVVMNPSLAEAWTWRARIQGRFGRLREARQNILKAMELDPLHERTAFFAANLAVDFYDPEFFAAVEKNSAQFPRIAQMLEGLRLTELEPVTAAVYRRIESVPDLDPRVLASIKLSALKEIDEEALSRASRRTGEVLMWTYMGIDQWEKAQSMYAALSPERQEAAINLEELSIMQANRGHCEQALESLRRAQGGEVRIHGLIDLNANRSNVNLALNRVHCLRKLERPVEAEAILSRVHEFIDTLWKNADRGYSLPDAKLRYLEGDISGALETLERAILRSELDWTIRYDPVLRMLGDEPQFQALFDDLDRRIDALRAELGMPPAEL